MVFYRLHNHDGVIDDQADRENKEQRATESVFIEKPSRGKTAMVPKKAGRGKDAWGTLPDLGR
jgi:hypothetical protein